MFATLRPVISRILAPWVAWGLAMLALKTGIVFDIGPATQDIIEVVLTLVASMMSISGITHKTVDAKLNPHDSASPVLAERKADETLAVP
jgi:hypothetical protein